MSTLFYLQNQNHVFLTHDSPPSPSSSASSSSSSSGTGLLFGTWLFLCWTPWSPSSACCSSSSSSSWSLPCWGCSCLEDSQYRSSRLCIVALSLPCSLQCFNIYLSLFLRFNFEGGTPPTNFDTFAAAIMTVFQVRKRRLQPHIADRRMTS